MKPTFLGHNRPLLVSMITDETPEECKCSIRNSIYDGADAFGIHLCHLLMEYHNEKTLREIFFYAQHRPIYTVHYRRADRPQLTDGDLADTQRLCLRAGGTLCDVMGDMFDRGAPKELSMKSEAVDKQKRYIDELHEMGGEVLMSTHIHSFLTAEETLIQAKEIESRGADIVKIVVQAKSEEEAQEAYRITMMLKNELKRPFLYLCMGKYGKVHRVLTPVFGSVMTLCVQQYRAHSLPDHPLLRATRAVYDNIDFGMNR